MQCHSLFRLDPRLLPKVSESEIVRPIDNLDVTLRRMVDARKMQPSQCDAVRAEYRAACENIAGGGSTAEYENFNPSVHRLDKLLFPVLGTNPKYASLWFLVKQILVLSHGQATVERGFSINKETATDNLSEKSLMARRLIIDAVNQVGDITLFPLTKELLSCASSARKKYYEYRVKEKADEKEKENMRKRKLDDAQQAEKKAKCARLAEDIKNLEAAADSKAMEAEKEENMHILIQSNALRRKAMEKKEEMKKMMRDLQ